LHAIIFKCLPYKNSVNEPRKAHLAGFCFQNETKVKNEVLCSSLKEEGGTQKIAPCPSSNLKRRRSPENSHFFFFGRTTTVGGSTGCCSSSRS
jgi:hypothetical protein